MSGRKEQEYILQEAARRELASRPHRQARIHDAQPGRGPGACRRRRGGEVGHWAGLRGGPSSDADLLPVDPGPSSRHPGGERQFPGINYQIAPVEGFGIERFVAEAKNKQSSWDVYVGQTPFVEMSAFIKAGVIEPWDNYIPKDVIDDIIPSIREECTVDGKLYSWPFLLDVIGSGWHSGITGKAGLPDAAPATWDDFLDGAKKIVDSKAAPWGATFDSHGWRSLAPITHSMSTNVYTLGRPVRLHQRARDRGAEADEDRSWPTSNPDILLEGASDAGVNGTPDEVAFAAAARRPLFQVLQRAAAHGGELGRSQAAASRPAAEVQERRRLDGVLDDGLRAVQVRPEQGEGRRIHQGADLRSADLEGFDRRHARAAIPANCRPTSRSTRTGTPTSRTGCRPSSAWCAASSTRPRRSTTTCSAYSSSSSASRSGRPTSRARSPIPKVAMQKVVDAVQRRDEERLNGVRARDRWRLAALAESPARVAGRALRADRARRCVGRHGRS